MTEIQVREILKKCLYRRRDSVFDEYYMIELQTIVFYWPIISVDSSFTDSELWNAVRSWMSSNKDKWLRIN